MGEGESVCVRRWLKRARYSDPGGTLRSLTSWHGWLGEADLEGFGVDPVLGGLDLDGLVDYQRERRDYQVLDAIQAYVSELDRRVSYKRLVYSRLKNFFSYNRVALPDDTGFKIVGDRPPVVGGISMAEIIRMLDSCNECYRAYFLCMFQGGMGQNEMNYWNFHGWESLERQLQRGVQPVKVELPGRKRNRNKKPFYTFIGRDSVDALKVWLRRRPAGLKVIFANQYGRPVERVHVRQYWTRHLLRLGLIERPKDADTRTRYGKSPHKLRSRFRTRWRLSGVDVEVAEFFMGHDIDQLGYDKSPWDHADWFEEQYLVAEPWLNIVSEDPERVPIRDHRKALREYEERNRRLRETLELFENRLRKLEAELQS